MTVVYDAPQEALDAWDAGYPTYIMIEIMLPATAGGPIRWTSAPWNITWKGQLYSAINPYKQLADTSTLVGEDGTLALVLSDPERGWSKRFQAAGPRGIAATVSAVVPMETIPKSLFEYDSLVGAVQTVSPTHGPNDSPETRVIVEDEMYYEYKPRGEKTSDAYQRSLDLTDDSHEIAHEARTLRWNLFQG